MEHFPLNYTNVVKEEKKRRIEIGMEHFPLNYVNVVTEEKKRIEINSSNDYILNTNQYANM